MSTEAQLERDFVLTATTGTNADLLPKIFRLYVPEGSRVADVTYGKGSCSHSRSSRADWRSCSFHT